MMGHTLTGFKSKFDDDLAEIPIIEGAEKETVHEGDSEEQIVIQYADEESPSEYDVNYDHHRESSETLFQHSSRSIGQIIAPSPTPLDVQECSENNDPNKLTASTSLIEKKIQKPVINDWSSYTPAKLKQQKSSKLKVPKKESTSTIKDKISTWALFTSDLVKSQKQAFEEEYKLKLQHMIEKHELFLEVQREEWKLRRTHMIEIHKQKLSNNSTD